MKPTGPLIAAGLALLPYQALADNDVHYASTKTITLKSDGNTPDVQIVDFGQDYEGHPTFEVVLASGNTSVFEVSFAEGYTAFDSYMVRRFAQLCVSRTCANQYLLPFYRVMAPSSWPQPWTRTASSGTTSRNPRCSKIA